MSIKTKIPFKKQDKYTGFLITGYSELFSLNSSAGGILRREIVHATSNSHSKIVVQHSNLIENISN